VVALAERREPGRVVRLPQDGRIDAAGGLEGLAEPAPALGHEPADAPEADQPACEPQPELDLAGLERPVERGSDVVVLLAEPLEPDRLAAAGELRLGGLCELDVAVEVPRPRVGKLASLREPLDRVLADRLEHAEPRLALGALALTDEPVVDERRNA